MNSICWDRSVSGGVGVVVPVEYAYVRDVWVNLHCVSIN